MALKNVPTIDELVETTGQTREQLERNREAVAEIVLQGDE